MSVQVLVNMGLNNVNIIKAKCVFLFFFFLIETTKKKEILIFSSWNVPVLFAGKKNTLTGMSTSVPC